MNFHSGIITFRLKNNRETGSGARKNVRAADGAKNDSARRISVGKRREIPVFPPFFGRGVFDNPAVSV